MNYAPMVMQALLFIGIIAIVFFALVVISNGKNKGKGKGAPLPRYLLIQKDDGNYYIADRHTMRIDGTIPTIGEGISDRDDAENELSLYNQPE